MLHDRHGHRVHAGNAHGLALPTELLRQLLEHTLLLLDGSVLPVRPGMGRHGGDDHHRHVGVQGRHSVDHGGEILLGQAGGVHAVVHAVGQHEKVTAEFLHLLGHVAVEVIHAVAGRPAADGGVDVGDGAPIPRHVVGGGYGMAGVRLGDAGLGVGHLVVKEIRQSLHEEHGVCALHGLDTLGVGGAGAPGDGVTVEEHGHVLAADELTHEVLIDLQVTLLNKTLPAVGVGVGHRDLPLLHLALPPVQRILPHLDDGARVVVVDLGGDAGDGGILGQLQHAVLHHVVLTLLVGDTAVVGGDRDKAFDGVQEGLYIALVDKHDGFLQGHRAAKDILHNLLQVCLLHVQADLLGEGVLGGLRGDRGLHRGGRVLGNGIVDRLLAGSKAHRHGPCQKQGAEQEQDAVDLFHSDPPIKHRVESETGISFPVSITSGSRSRSGSGAGSERRRGRTSRWDG